MKCLRLACFLLSLLASVHSLRAADVSLFGVIKSSEFRQTNATPVALASNGYAFNAFVIATTNGVVTNATVKPSNGTPVRTLLPESDGLSLRFEERFHTQAALDATYPVGNFLSSTKYNFTNDTVNDGVRSTILDFLGVLLLGNPPTPTITSLSAAQSIDQTSDFMLRWNSLGGSTLDIVQLFVLDSASNTVFSSPAPFAPNALNGTATSIIIPAHTMPSDSLLEGHLTIARPGTINSNYAVGVTAVLKDTGFPLRTRPAPSAPRLEVLAPNAGQFQLRLTGETNRHYQIQATEDFQTWSSLLATNSASGAFNYTDPQSDAFRHRTYRGKVGN
jgi:hypothetical protein